MRSRTADLGDEFWIGQRVLDDGGFVATVRYVGPVVSSKSTDSTVTWIGVEFDELNRGKHSTGAVEHPITGVQVRRFTIHCIILIIIFIIISWFYWCNLSVQQIRFSTFQSNLEVAVHFSSLGDLIGDSLY